MKIVMFCDTHYGTRSNSMSWFHSQMDFVRGQMIPYIKSLDEEVVLIHLGDVFDSRSTVNTYIAQEVKELFEELAGLVQDFYVLQGNHDGYSPNDPKYNTLDLILGSIRNENFHIVSSMEQLCLSCIPPCATEKCAILLPWFIQAKESPEEFTKRYKGHVIFTHADIIMGNPKLYTPVFSGHVHIPYINGKVRNLGSCFPLDFHDANSQRYFYVWDPEDDSLIRHANTQSIQFHRVYNEDVLTKDWDKVGLNDYIEVYIKYSLLQDDEYQALCKKLRNDFKHCWIIPVADELAESTEEINCDIGGIIDRSIPDDLREIFEEVKQEVKNRDNEHS